MSVAIAAGRVDAQDTARRDPEGELPTVQVAGTTPLPGSDQPIDEIPGNVRVYDARHLRSDPSVAGFLRDRAASFTAEDAQGNAWASNVSFRGFSASPLLGSPQGLSVFLDGVRVNEAFGDIVNWDLLPRNAIAQVTVVPGSSPAFGLNSLGGAIALTTKNGRIDPGGEAEATVGSFGRRAIELSYGGMFAGDLDGFIAATDHHDTGWRRRSSSNVRQLYSSVGWRDEVTRIRVSTLVARNSIEGVQALPVSFLDRPREPYTSPDGTVNRLASLTVSAERDVGDAHAFGANAYVRRLRSGTLNSNVNPACGPDTCDSNAYNLRIRTLERRTGAGVQWAWRENRGAWRNRALMAVSAESARTDLAGTVQPATFDGNREAIGIAPETPTTVARTHGRSQLFTASDTVSFDDRAHLTLTGTYVEDRISLRDASGTTPELDGDHRYSRFNPTAGLTVMLTPRTSLYALEGRSLRAPTTIELNCADPSAPCQLPNLFLADPPLKAVVAHTHEIGLRMRGKLSASLALFRTDLRDDLQFVSAGGAGTSTGYFRNVGRTRRTGFEATLDYDGRPFELSASFLRLQATYRDPFVEFSPNNATANDNGEITVNPGARLPGLPRDTLKLNARWHFVDRASIGIGMLASTGRFTRGNENNLDPDGRVPGSATFTLESALVVARGVELTLGVSNLFDRRYSTGGVLGANYFNGPGRTFASSPTSENFLTPGTARTIWLSARMRFPD